jgi:hypothetical protein
VKKSSNGSEFFVLSIWTLLISLDKKEITVKLKRFLSVGLFWTGFAFQIFAGNDSKKGQAGAVELLINPWARSSGMSGANTGIVRGIESMGLNVAGLNGIRKTEINFCSALYLVGSQININSLGLAQRVGETGTMGLTLTSFDLGTFYETTVELPDGTGNTFKPQIFNFGAAYSKKFSNRISGGLLVRGISQSYNAASAFGVAFDAGIQYQTGKRKEFKFGVSIMNLGPKMNFGGTLFTDRGRYQNGSFDQTSGLLTAAFEQPSMLNIGVGYDFYFENEIVKLTPIFNFRSNSFTHDQYQFGVQASWKEMFMVRGGYDYQAGIFNKDESTTATLGPSAGVTFQVPFMKNSSGEMVQESDKELYSGTHKSRILALDYSYTLTRYFGGTHRFALLVTL